MVFTAYDKVHFTQYEKYQRYAEMVPGKGAHLFAQEILGNEPKDSPARLITAELKALKRVLDLVMEEYFLFVIVNAAGDAFDVYLLDEDSLFRGFIPNVTKEDVLDAGEQLMRLDYLD